MENNQTFAEKFQNISKSIFFKVLILTLNGIAVLYLWNNILVPLTGVGLIPNPITAIGLTLLIRLLMGNFKVNSEKPSMVLMNVNSPISEDIKPTVNESNS